MNKEELIKYIELDYSIAKLAEHFKKGKSTIQYWLKKYGLKTNKNKYNRKDKNKIDESITHKICNKCGMEKSITDFYFRKNRNTYQNSCKKCHNNKKSYKKDFINYKGISCEICGIKSDISAIYDFHHKDPTEKEFQITKYKNTKLNDKIKYEIDKCHLLCSNCHREVHGGLHPDYLIKKEVELIDYTTKYKENELKKCHICKLHKPFSQYYKYYDRETYHKRCKKCSNNKCTIRLRKIKEQCVKYKGGKCQHCGYNKYLGALEFHHTNPAEKDFSISGNLGPFETHKKELDKCICLCLVCHRIEHHRLRQKGVKIVE